MSRVIEHVDQRQTVPAPDFEIVEVMRRRDLDSARALFRIGVLIGNDGYAPADQRQDRGLADQMFEPLVLRMHRNSDVAEHRLRPRRGDDDEFARVLDRIFDVPKLALALDLLHFEIGNRGLELGIPVDEPLVLVDQPFAVQRDKNLQHRAR